MPRNIDEKPALTPDEVNALCELNRAADEQIKGSLTACSSARHPCVKSYAQDLVSCYSSLNLKISQLVDASPSSLHPIKAITNNTTPLDPLEDPPLTFSYLRQYGIINQQKILTVLEEIKNNSHNIDLKNFAITQRPIIEIEYKTAKKLTQIYSEEA
ncbi:DUF4142 domain-containing protein [Comamonadaceae bacterium PP-2]